MKKIACMAVAAAFTAILFTTPAAAEQINNDAYLNDVYVLKHGPTTAEEAAACLASKPSPASDNWELTADCSVHEITEQEYQDAVNRRDAFDNSFIGRILNFFAQLKSFLGLSSLSS